MGSLPIYSQNEDIPVTQPKEEGGQEVSLSINPSDISFPTSQSLKEGAFICQLL